ncbi:hypothetical protein DL767_006552 [Monosporascus sp. MG133]|nr:hypothetical protein DL767_006552 [Monosporascus sp. MG133]
MVNFDYAYGAWDYASYHLSGNLTAYAQREGSTNQAISGSTLACRILAQFQAHLAAAQDTHKLNLMFGSFEPFLAFFALSTLADDELPSEEDLLGAEKMASGPDLSVANNGTKDARAGSRELGGPGAPPLAALRCHSQG